MARKYEISIYECKTERDDGSYADRHEIYSQEVEDLNVQQVIAVVNGLLHKFVVE